MKDESTELRQEIQRKDEIVKKHNDKLANCLKMLQDAQQQQKTAVGPNMPLASPSSSSTTNLNSQTRPQKPGIYYITLSLFYKQQFISNKLETGQIF